MKNFHFSFRYFREQLYVTIQIMIKKKIEGIEEIYFIRLYTVYCHTCCMSPFRVIVCPY